MYLYASKERTRTHTHIYIQEFHVYLQLYCWYLVVFPGLKGSPKPSSIESSDLVKTLNVPTKARSSRFRNRRMLDPSKFVLPPLPHHLIVLHKRKHPGALLLLLLLCLLLPLVTPPPCRASIHTKLLVDFVKVMRAWSERCNKNEKSVVDRNHPIKGCTSGARKV